MKLDLFVQYIGYGKRCSGCGLTRETTRFVLRTGERIIGEYLLCDTCQDRGGSLRFNVNCRSVTSNRMAKRRTIKLSRKLEKGVADDVGGYTTSGSGNGDDKDDVVVRGEWRIEHKFTKSASAFSLKTSQLKAVTEHASASGERPALVIDFRRLAKKFVVITYDTFLELVEKLRD